MAPAAFAESAAFRASRVTESKSFAPVRVIAAPASFNVRATSVVPDIAPVCVMAPPAIISTVEAVLAKVSCTPSVSVY